MNSGRYVLSQILDLVHWQTLNRLAAKHAPGSRCRHLGFRQQFICMVFAQLTWREGLRDIVECLNARRETLYHLGFSSPVARSTLAEANEQRDWRIWEALAQGLIRKARPLYAGEDLGLDLDNTVYVLDSGYMDFARLARIADAAASFVNRAKSNLRFSRQFSMPVDRSTGLRSDQVGRPTLPGARRDFPHMLRRVRYFDETSGRCFVFLTNNLTIPALSVALLYKSRWQVELFFKWVKGHLRVKHYYGNSANAVRTQIWIAVCTYVMIAILHKQLGLPGTLHRTLQLLSVHPFAKVPLAELLMETDSGNPTNPNPNQLSLWDL